MSKLKPCAILLALACLAATPTGPRVYSWDVVPDAEYYRGYSCSPNPRCWYSPIYVYPDACDSERCSIEVERWGNRWIVVQACTFAGGCAMGVASIEGQSVDRRVCGEG